jgi:putative redox protein
MMTLTLAWQGGEAFENAPSSPAIRLESGSRHVASPPEALAYAVMGCMGLDVVEILQKGRHQLTSLTIRFVGERASEPPRRFLRMALGFDVVTSAPIEAVERAVELSRAKYCSVWHTLRPDVELRTSLTVRAVS